MIYREVCGDEDCAAC